MADKLKLDRSAMKNRSTAHLRVYVGGLTEQAQIEDLYDHFISIGEIDGIVINRGFGFVQFADEASVSKAINQKNGSNYQGKSITVKPAVANDKPRIPDPAPSHATNDEHNQSESASQSVTNEDSEELYDNQGNYIGDQPQGPYRDEYQDPFNDGYNAPQGRGGGRGRPPMRGRGHPMGMRGGRGGFRERSPIRRGPAGGDWNERGTYDRFQQPMPEYPRALPVPERNDCEIIVVSKALTEYAEYLENRLKRLGIVVDLLFPMEDVPIGKVLGNIASRGCLYAILVMPLNQENRSLTLTMLHGLPQEHRNMPVEDALQLMSRNFAEVQRGGTTGREAVYALLGQLADGRTLTAMQYDKVIEYLQERREQQVKVELGEPLATNASSKTQVDLQQRILSILNDKKAEPAAPAPAPAAAPAASAQNKLLNDPTVRKALDSILQKFV